MSTKFIFRKVLVGYDGSRGAKAALECAAAMAGEHDIAVTALWVRRPLPRYSDLLGEVKGEKEAADEYYSACCTEVFRVAKRHGIDIRCKTSRGHPAKTILRVADEDGYDLIVIGHSDHSELWGRLLGDTADRIADHAHCSVLVVKKQETDFHTVS
jgi:nucleotide-binding universal stress UspA family protein